jgi:hypothetical protein
MPGFILLVHLRTLLLICRTNENIHHLNQKIMKYVFIFLCCFLSITSFFAQKKGAPVSQSALTGIALPTGSIHDKRISMTSAAKMLMEMESKKTNITVSATEVLLLPAASLSGYSKEKTIQSLSESGWVVSENDGDKKYSWLQKGSRSLMMYFSNAKNESNLYFAVTSAVPTQNTQVTNTNNNQTIPAEKNQLQQSTDTPVQPNSGEVIQQTNQTVPAPASSGFAFTTTNFDDGWTSTVQEDWVAVTKGNMKVLLHYPKEGTVFPADPDVLTSTAWNILVAPRYSNLKKYKTSYIATYNRPYLGMGYAVENATGKNVFIVFFRQGHSGWTEFVAPDKDSFIQQYKFDPEAIQWDSESDLLIPLANMTVYSKFAVAASDINGKWTSDFTGIQQLYYVYTGNYAGMQINQSNEEFFFGQGYTYKWKLLVVNGMAGNAKANQVQSSGTFTVLNNWQVKFSKIESGPKTFNAYWSCIKGARILNLLDAQYPGSGIYTKYGLAK